MTTVGEYDALNDVVLSRGGLARVVRISMKLDGSYLTTYTCDGLIVSTATGSTGYALAVDGPILPPELRNILVLASCRPSQHGSRNRLGRGNRNPLASV